MSILFISFAAAILALASANPEPPRAATATLTTRNPLTAQNNNVIITVAITESGNGVRVLAAVTGLAAGSYTLRVHQLGEITTCDGTGADFIPTGSEAQELGTVTLSTTTPVGSIDITNELLTLRGRNNILGRSLVLHNDDGGARVACGVIGILNPSDPWFTNSAVIGSPSFLLLFATAFAIYFKQ